LELLEVEMIGGHFTGIFIDRACTVPYLIGENLTAFEM
jgi:hypothetical protein